MSFLKQVSLTIFLLAGINSIAQKLKITPEFPQRGQTLTIQYNPKAEGATIPDTASGISLVFTYSNLYELPWKMKLNKVGEIWETSFVLPRYAAYATFYVQSANAKDQPAADKHYAIAVFDANKQRVQNGYLYEGYSLASQTGKTPELERNKAALYEEELKNYPDNYEAKIRLLAYKRSVAPASEKQQFRKQAHEIIEAKFMEHPGNMGNINKATMAYLILGENFRVDSLYNIVKQKYPLTEAGTDLLISDISDEPDTLIRVNKLLKILENENAGNVSFYKDAHKALMEYYAGKGDVQRVLFHLQKAGADTTPYKPQTLKKQAEIFLNAGILLDSALRFANEALAMADEFPAGLIRYFPEWGFLPAHVEPDVKTKNTEKTKGNMLSIIGLISLKQGDVAKGNRSIEQALKTSEDVETLSNASKFYDAINAHEKSFYALKKIMFQKPEDTLTMDKMKTVYSKWNKNSAGLQVHIKELKDFWRSEMLARLQKEIIKVKAPEFASSFVHLNNKPIDPELIKNKIIILDFWATWCGPCMKAMPYMQKAYETFKDDKGVLFMIVNSGSNNTLQDAQGWWGNKTFTFPVFYNNDKRLGDKLGFNVIPATYIIDTHEDVRFKTLGFEGPVMQRKIETAIEMLKEKAE